MHDSIKIFDQLKRIICYTWIAGCSEKDVGRGNYHVNLSLGPGINPSNYEDTLHYSPGGLEVVAATD